MTDREFDDLLKTAFDRYAKETLAKIPENIPDIPERPRNTRRPAAKRRNAAMILLSAACVGLLTLSVLLIAKISAQDPAPLPTLPTVSQSKPDNSSSILSPAQTLPETNPGNTGLPGTSPAPPPTDSVTEQIYPHLFHSLLNGQPSSGDTGEFADPLLVHAELPELSDPIHTAENRAFDKRTGGSYEFWNGEVQVFLQYETPVLPIAVSFTFGNPALLPRTCILMGQNADGNWVELKSYTCKISREDVTVAFYLDFEDDDLAEGRRYTDFYLSYQYVAMPDESYEVPTARLYGFAGDVSAFRFARYYAGDGSLYAVSTNAERLTLPDNFGGSVLHTVRQDAISGDFAPVLSALTIPKGVQNIETGAFIRCAALQSVSLPATLTLPIPAGRENSQDAELFREEILQNADLNGDGLIGAPLSAVFKDCENLAEVSVAEGNPEIESRNGSVYLRDSDVLLFSAKE